MNHSETRATLMTIAQLIVEHSQGRASMAYQADVVTADKASDAAHLINVDGRRIGRYIELYGFMGDGSVGWEATLAQFLEEVLLPVKGSGLADAYAAAGEQLKKLGHKVYPPEIHTNWDALF